MKRMIAIVSAVALGAAVWPASPAHGMQKAFDKAVKKVEATFSPAEAKPGQTVTLSITLELNEGYHTYPTAQPDKMAAAMVNDIQFPNPGTVIFVDRLVDPKNALTKSEPELGILELRYCTGTVTYSRKAVVSPKAAAGSATVKIDTFRVNICDKDNCFPPKKVPLEAKLKVLDGPAVEVEKAYAEEVKKALAK